MLIYPRTPAQIWAVVGVALILLAIAFREYLLTLLFGGILWLIFYH